MQHSIFVDKAITFSLDRRTLLWLRFSKLHNMHKCLLHWVCRSQYLNSLAGSRSWPRFKLNLTCEANTLSTPFSWGFLKPYGLMWTDKEKVEYHVCYNCMFPKSGQRNSLLCHRWWFKKMKTNNVILFVFAVVPSM